MLIFVKIASTKIDTRSVGNQGQQHNKSFRNANNNDIIIMLK